MASSTTTASSRGYESYCWIDSFVRSLFEEKLVVDDRVPVVVFSAPSRITKIISPAARLFVPNIHDDTTGTTTTTTTTTTTAGHTESIAGDKYDDYGIYLPRFVYWNQLVVLLLIQLIIQSAFALFIYRYIVQKRGTTASFLLGYGVVIPLALYIPYEMLEILDIQNRAIKFAVGSLPTIVCFRTLEAMYGTTSDMKIVESSLANYIAYYSTLAHFEWDDTTYQRRRIDTRKLVRNLTKILVHYNLVSILLSFEIHHNFKPFRSNVELDGFQLGWELLSPSHLANCYVLGFVTFYMLCIGFEITALAENLKGYDTKPVFINNPIVTSRSPSDFWGKRWNLIIHRTLKHGVYLPARQYFSPTVSVMLTFVASGLLHDYSWSLIFYTHDHKRDANGNCLDCWTPFPLKVTAFFIWNGAIILLQRPLAKHFEWTRNLPTTVVSTMVILCALPVSHWFTGDWAIGGQFPDFSMALWQIKKLPNETAQ